MILSSLYIFKKIDGSKSRMDCVASTADYEEFECKRADKDISQKTPSAYYLCTLYPLFIWCNANLPKIIKKCRKKFGGYMGVLYFRVG